MEEISVKGLMQPCEGSGWFGHSWNINLYRGCCHGCIYCDSRSACYQVHEFDRVRCKKDALTLLERELRAKHRRGVVGMGAMRTCWRALASGGQRWPRLPLPQQRMRSRER